MAEREGGKFGRGKSKVKFAVVLSILALCLVLCSVMLGKWRSGISNTESQRDDGKNPLVKAADDDGNEAYEEGDVALSIMSEDGKCKVFVKKDQRQKLYIHHVEEGRLDEIDVMPDLADAIMSLEWIDANQVAVWSHVNPSCGCLDIYDVNTLQKQEEKYCSKYAWSKGMDSLIYVEPVPHNPSAVGKEKILNLNDEFLYQTKKFVIIRSMDINDRGEIAIIVEKVNKNHDVQTAGIMILKKKGNKYQAIKKIKLKNGGCGEIEWIDHKTISYSTGEGGKKVKKLVG